MLKIRHIAKPKTVIGYFMTATMNLQEANDLDLILQTSIDTPDIVYSVEEVQKLLFSDKDYNYCLNLYYILSNSYPGLLLPESGTKPEYFWANDYAKAFLHQGGFTRKYNDEFDRVTKQEIIDSLSLDKLAAEVDIFRFQKGLGKRLTIWGFAIATISVIASILTTIISSNKTPDNDLKKPIFDTVSLKMQLQNFETRLQKLELQRGKDTAPK